MHRGRIIILGKHLSPDSLPSPAQLLSLETDSIYKGIEMIGRDLIIGHGNRASEPRLLPEASVIDME